MVLEWEWKEQLVYSLSWENWENLNIKRKLCESFIMYA